MFSRYPVRLSVNRRSAGTWLVVVIGLARKANRGRSARGSRHEVAHRTAAAARSDTCPRRCTAALKESNCTGG